MRPERIADEARVNERRASIGRVRLELQKRMIAEVFGAACDQR